MKADDLSVAVYDTGFVLGVTVTEQLRTFRGRIFRLDEHLDRLLHSLELVEITPEISRKQLAAAAEELVAGNHRLLAEGDDLGLCIFVTPGPDGKMSGPIQMRPNVCMHT